MLNSSESALVKRCLLLSALLSPPAAALEWTATEVEALHSSRFREPFNSNAVSKYILTLQHAHGYSLGRNFMFVDLARSGNQERDALGNPESPSEIYGEAYTTLSLSRLSGKPVGAGPLRDVGFTAGINLGAKDSAFNPEPRVYLAGITVDFAVPRGFFNVDLLGYWDHGCNSGGCPDYRASYQLTPSWSIPFSLGRVDGEFTGFVDIIGARGAGTVRQVLSQPQLRFDIGAAFGQKGQLYAGIEYQYWRNKFGVDGANESHPQLLLAWKF